MGAKIKSVSRLMGGLGNQMFQYATGLALSRKLGADHLLDVSYYKIDEKLDNTPRELELGVFNLQYKKYSGVLGNYIFNKFINKFSFLRKTFLPLFRIFYFTDVDDLQKAVEIKQNGTFYLDGYWPSYLFFNDYKAEIKEVYTFDKTINEVNLELSNIMSNQSSVAIHIRRTDYLKSNSSHKVLKASYYKDAIAYIKSKVSNPVFYFFGDDHEWIRDNFFIDNSNYFLINKNVGISSHLDMFLMTSCKHIIISNSTFSWWAAYLNKFKDNITVAPLDWFKEGGCDYFVHEKLIPGEWMKF
jgi:hypothetical protein